MKSLKLHHKIFAIVLASTFAFQSMSQINEHTYTTGFNNFHKDYSFSCFPTDNTDHFSYDCGQTFHLY